MMGPSIVPSPPMTTMNSAYAVQLMLNAAAAERGDEVDVELRTEDVDTGALRRQLVVADGREGEAEPRAQQEVDEQDRAHGNEQREQVRTSDARIDRQASGGDDGLAGPAARGLDVGHDEADHLSDHPGADGEVAAAQAEDERRHREGDGGGKHSGKDDGDERVKPDHVADQPQTVCSETEVRLLADGDQTSVTAEKVPHLGEGEQREEGDHGPQEAHLGPQREDGEYRHDEHADDEHVAMHARRARHAKVCLLYT